MLDRIKTMTSDLSEGFEWSEVPRIIGWSLFLAWFVFLLVVACQPPL